MSAPAKLGAFAAALAAVFALGAGLGATIGPSTDEPPAVGPTPTVDAHGGH